MVKIIGSWVHNLCKLSILFMILISKEWELLNLLTLSEILIISKYEEYIYSYLRIYIFNF